MPNQKPSVNIQVMLTSVRGEQMGGHNVANRQIDYFLVLMIYLDITLWIRIRFFVAAGPAFARITP